MISELRMLIIEWLINIQLWLMPKDHVDAIRLTGHFRDYLKEGMEERNES